MEYIMHIGIIIGIYMILAMSLDIIVGYTGIPSLGHAAFPLIGAYVSSLLTIHLHFNPIIALFCAGLFSALAGLAAAYPSVNLKGDYLALATLGIGIITVSITKNWIGLTRGAMGLPGVPAFALGNFELHYTWQYLILVIFFVAFTYYVLNLLVHRPFGLLLRAIREDEIAAQAVGKPTPFIKLKVFMVGAFFGGISGSLYAHYIGFISPTTFSISESVSILLMVIFGGAGTLKGPLIGATVLISVPELLRLIGVPTLMAAQIRQIFYGLLLVVLMIYKPQGILGKYQWK